MGMRSLETLNTNHSGTGTILVREDELRTRIKLSHATIWRLVRQDKFPRPISIGERAKAWRLSDIEAWIASRAQAGADHGC